MLTENLLGQHILFLTNAINVDLSKDGIMLNALNLGPNTDMLNKPTY